MKMVTERLKFSDIFPDKAAEVAQRLHIKKDEIPFVRKYYTAEKDKTEVKKKERAVISYISTGIKDRDGEKLVPEGAVIANYQKNPVVPFAHDYRSIPPAKNMWIKRDEKGLIAKTVFAKNQRADELYKAYTEDVGGTGPLLNAWSVGFIPIDWEDTEAKALEKDPDLPKRTYNKWEMLEYSAVPIPSCPEALTIAVEKGLISEKLQKELEIEVVKDVEDKEIEVEWGEKEKEIEIEMVGEIIHNPDMVIIDKEGEVIVTKPETPADYHRIPVESPDKHKGHRIRTITISAEKGGIKALYCGECKVVITYLFDVKKWTMEEAKAWVDEHKAVTERYVETKMKKEPQHKKRWNKSLSKLFDIERVESRPASFNYALLEKFLECKVKQIFQNSYTIPSPLLGTYLAGFKEILKGFDLKDTRNFGYGGAESPPLSEVIKLNSKESDDFLISGTRFYDADGTPVVIDYQPTWYGIQVSISTSSKNKIWNKELLEKVHDWVHENNFLKGEKFALSGDFLSEPEDGWANLVLDEKAKDSVNKTVNFLAKKKEKATGRGLLFIGPPGTGKTKTGRVLMNEIDSTFIWVSSRDFRRVGPLSGLALAFSLARDLAPTILFIEDVDTWLSGRDSYATDLIKTELDGIRQNKGMITVLTSNFPEKLPDALLDRPGRFHHIVNFELPGEKQRGEMIKLWAKDIDKELLADIVKKTDGFSGAHLKELVEFAKMIADEEEIDIGKAMLRSLDKLTEQRELIEEIRANKDDVKAVWGQVKYIDGEISMKEDMEIEIESKQEKYKCECIKCGHKLTSDKHCKDIKCPECGGTMRRQERPGPGQDGGSGSPMVVASDVGTELTEKEKKDWKEQQEEVFGQIYTTEEGIIVSHMQYPFAEAGDWMEVKFWEEFEEDSKLPGLKEAIEHIRDTYEKLLSEKDEHIADLKAGRVLSRKNRNIVKDAITALNAVLKADAVGTEEDTESESGGAVTERTIELEKDGNKKTFTTEDIGIVVEKVLAEKAESIIERAFEKSSDPEVIKKRVQDGVKLEIDRIKGKVR